MLPFCSEFHLVSLFKYYNILKRLQNYCRLVFKRSFQGCTLYGNALYTWLNTVNSCTLQVCHIRVGSYSSASCRGIQQNDSSFVTYNTIIFWCQISTIFKPFQLAWLRDRFFSLWDRPVPIFSNVRFSYLALVQDKKIMCVLPANACCTVYVNTDYIW